MLGRSLFREFKNVFVVQKPKKEKERERKKVTGILRVANTLI